MGRADIRGGTGLFWCRANAAPIQSGKGPVSVDRLGREGLLLGDDFPTRMADTRSALQKQPSQSQSQRPRGSEIGSSSTHPLSHGKRQPQARRRAGRPNGAIRAAKTQRIGPPTVPALSSMTPGTTSANRNARSAIPMATTPIRYPAHEAPQY